MVVNVPNREAVKERKFCKWLTDKNDNHEDGCKFVGNYGQPDVDCAYCQLHKLADKKVIRY